MTFRIAQLSDLHLGPLPKVRRRDLFSKRITGYINWHRNRAGRDESQALSRLIADMQAQEPDHIAVTGDLTNLALPAEIDSAAVWLSTLGPPDRVTVIPGNHDAYVPGAARNFRRAWAPWMRSDGDDGDGPAHFPFVRRRGPVALIGVSSAVATAPFWATGRVGLLQTRAFAGLLDETGKEGLFRVVLVHHPPIRVRGIKRFSRRLIDGRRFRATIRDHGAELILHGHDHVRAVGHIEHASGPVPVVGVPAGAGFHKKGKPVPDGRAAGYALHEIKEDGEGYALTIVHRAFTAGGDIVETDRFAMRLAQPG